MSKNHFRTDFLFSDATLLIGMGSILNIAGNYFDFNESASPAEADSQAVENDWGVIGDDLRNVILSPDNAAQVS